MCLKYMKPAMCMCVLEIRAIRAGDCLGMLVEFFYANRQMEEAYKYLREVLYILPLVALHAYMHTYIHTYIHTHTHISIFINTKETNTYIHTYTY